MSFLSILLFSILVLTNFVYSYGFCYKLLVVENKKVFKAVSCLGISLFLFVSVTYLHLILVLKPHKPIDERFKLERERSEKLLRNIVTRNEQSEIRLCLKCKIIQPDRAYHCKKCSKCILKRDHHCEWLDNCIGYSNQKYFLLLLFYSLVYILFMQFSLFYYSSDFSASTCVLIIGNFLAFILVGLLFVNGLYLCAKNSTNIEETYPPRVRKENFSDFCLLSRLKQDQIGIFDLGEWRRNIEQVFGSSLILAFLPVWTTKGNGHVFPTILNI
jgi:hypothetical protein